MKRVILVLLIAVFAIPTFQSCKKGENDPSISLKSRKSRLVGDWTLKEGSITMTNGGSSGVITYNGSTESYSTGGSYSYTLKATIKKDGTFESTLLEDGDLTVTEGQWYFLEGNKDKDLKSKECVAFVNTKVTNTPAGNPTTISTFNSIIPDATWQLDKLSSKEMIIIFDEQYSTGSSFSKTGTLTFTKSK
jgi:hypothetical protein